MEFLGAIADRFAAYIDELTKIVAHADRAEPLRDYCAGLLVTEGRRSVEPMAAVTAPAEVSAQHSVDRQSRWQSADRLSALSATGLDRR